MPTLTNSHRAHSRTVRPSRPWQVNFKLTLGGSTFTVEDGILDSGSDDFLLPKRLIPPDLLQHLDESNYIIKGVNGASKASGQFESAVCIGDATFNDIRIIVTDHERTPPLIGRTVIDHPSTVIFGRRGTEIFVQRRLAPDSEIVTQSFELNGESRYWNTTRKTPSAPAQQIGLPVRHEADLSSGAQNVDDDVFSCASLNDTSIQARNGTVSTSIPPKRDKPGQNANTSELRTWLETHKNLVLPKHHVNPDELHSIAKLLVEFEDVFGGENEPLGEFTKPVRIPTTGKSACRKQHQIQHRNQEVVDAEVERMAAAGVIEPCANPRGFNTPLHCVEKKDGSPRVVSNFKNTLNTVLKDPDPYTMPNLREVFNEVRPGIQYLASVDFRSGYWQIVLDTRDRYKTAFTWKGQTWQYTRLPFGLTCAGQIFSRAVSEALETIPDLEGIFVYVDDVLLATPTFSAYLKKLRSLFEASRKFGLRLHPGKCHFLAKSVKFLGRVLSPQGMSVDPDHSSGIDALTPPTTRTELRCLLGRLTFIREFLDCRLHERIDTSCFSKLVYELNRNGDFYWSHEANAAFENVKKRLKSSPIISYPDPSKDFLLVTDASEVAVGAVLLQLIDGKESIVGVASRTFTAVETRWSTTEREAYGILFGVRRFDYFLRSRPFVVKTDHAALQYIDSVDHKNAKLSRWMDELSSYRFCVEYIPGEENVWADMFSRPFGLKKPAHSDVHVPAGKFVDFENGLRAYVPSWCTKNQVRQPVGTSPKLLREGITRALLARKDEFILNATAEGYLKLACDQRDNHSIRGLIDALQKFKHDPKAIKLDKNDHNYDVYRVNWPFFMICARTDLLLHVKDGKHRQVLPPENVARLLHHSHDSCAHPGTSRVADSLQSYWWPSKDEDIKNYVASCVICAKKKGSQGHPSNPDIGHCKRGERPFDVIFIDFTVFDKVNGKRFCCTILDSFTKFFIAKPVPGERAIDAARCIVEEVVLRHQCIPKIVSSDKGTAFISATMKELYKQLGMVAEYHTAWRPQSTGNLERQHRTFKSMIFMMQHERRMTWIDCVPFVTAYMNSHKNKSTGQAPNTLVTGRRPRFHLPETIHDPDVSSDSPSTYGKIIRERLELLHSFAKIANKAADLELEKKLEDAQET